MHFLRFFERENDRLILFALDLFILVKNKNLSNKISNFLNVENSVQHYLFKKKNKTNPVTYLKLIAQVENHINLVYMFQVLKILICDIFEKIRAALALNVVVCMHACSNLGALG